MTKIIVEASDASVTVRGRNIATGNDGSVTTVEAGKRASIEIDAGNEAVVSIAQVTESTSAPNAPTAEVMTDEDDKGPDLTKQEPQLRDGSDEEVTAALSTLHARDDVNRTTKGYIDVESVNAALAEQGIAPIDAARRTSLSDAGGFVKA